MRHCHEGDVALQFIAVLQTTEEHPTLSVRGRAQVDLMYR